MGPIKGIPNAAMEVVLNLPPFDIFVIGEARMAAYRLQCNRNWQHHHASNRSKISDILKLDIVEMMSDRMSKKTLCRKCGEAGETAEHVVFECPATQSKHSRSVRFLRHTEEGLEQASIVQKISGFVKTWDLIQLKPGRGCTISRVAEGNYQAQDTWHSAVNYEERFLESSMEDTPTSRKRSKFAGNDSLSDGEIENGDISETKENEAEESETEEISEYEKLRLKNLEENRRMMIELGLLNPMKEKQVIRKIQKPKVKSKPKLQDTT
ncbi:hypothetical protein J6590_052448 [Homalodisca vitripennis]|nr:hypothetical protein J6590_052448 [Homalodisca vitripennis]